MDTYDFNLPSTQKTPEINCDASMGTVRINGNCVPEDAVDFFVPLKNWLSNHGHSDSAKTEIFVNLHYFNTSTSRVLLNLFRIAQTHQEMGKTVKVYWQYDIDDEDIREAGEDYQNILGDFIVLQAVGP